jgi:hypothetical protein
LAASIVGTNIQGQVSDITLLFICAKILLEQTGHITGSYCGMCVVQAGKTFQVFWPSADG